jgi:hypothetical protein
MTYRSAIAFRRALTDHLKKVEAASGQPYNQLLRRFVMERFLVRVFWDQQNSSWELKGGTGLMFRLPVARFSRDIDLHHRVGIEEGIDALRRAAAFPVPDLDWLTFRIGTPRHMSDPATGVTLRVEALTDLAVLDDFTIDLSVNLGREPSDLVEVSPLLHLDGIVPPPPHRIHPLHAQVADKVCAMYEVHGSSAVPSTRYRDLVDLVLIAQTQEISGPLAIAALDRERARRRVALPTRLISPHPTWATQYPRTARASRVVGSELEPLEASLAFAARMIDPLLRQSAGHRSWNGDLGDWIVIPS